MFSFLEKLAGLTADPAETSTEAKEETDFEADGFLLVGQTEIEKNQTSNIPNIPSTLSQNTCVSGYNVESSKKNCFTENQTTARHVSPLSGIPFKLSPRLEIYSKYSDFEIHSIPHENSSLQKYNYDFSFEKSLLRDLDQTVENLSSPDSFQPDLITF
ncbi:uncharacterized protein LOC115211056 [Argonauta hians]